MQNQAKVDDDQVKKKKRKKKRKQLKSSNDVKKMKKTEHAESTTPPKEEAPKISLFPFLKELTDNPLLVSVVDDEVTAVPPTEDEIPLTTIHTEIEEGEISIDQIVTPKSRPNKNKKPRPSKPKEIPVCRRWINGKCYKREECPFLHQGEQIKSSEICKFFRTGNCSRGLDCLYSHNLKSEACKFLSLRGQCGKGEDCPYSHEPQDIQKAIEIHKQKLEEQKRMEENSLPIPKHITENLVAFENLSCPN